MVSVYNACDTFGNIVSPLPTPSLIATGEVATFAELLCPYLILIPGVGARCQSGSCAMPALHCLAPESPERRN